MSTAIDSEALKARYGFSDFARERSVRRIESLIRMAPTSLEAHARLLHRDDTGKRFTAFRHHREWVRILEDREQYPWVVVVAPPAFAKSSWFSWAYIAWRLGVTGGSTRIGMISKTATQAYGWANAVARTIENPLFEKAYPGVAPDYERGWSQQQLFLSGTPEGPNPSLFASGIGGPIQGKRFDEIVVDDPVNWDDAKSETIMQGIRHWLKGVLMQRYPPGKGPPDGEGRCTVVLTRWGERDLVPTFEDLGFQIITMPALGYWDRTEHEDGEVEWGEEPLWPEAVSREKLEQEREADEIIFELVMQGNARAMAGDMFDGETFQRGVVPGPSAFDRAENGRVIQYVDTAGGKDRARGDFFALATVGVTTKSEVWVLGMERHKKPAPDQQRSVIQQYELWSEYGYAPDLIVIEEANEGIALYQNLVASTRLPLLGYSPQKDKEWRAIPLANAYRARRVWHPEREKWVRSYESELLAFPGGAHDDQVDAAAGAYAHTLRSGPRVRVLR